MSAAHDFLALEQEAHLQGYPLVCGVDEAGAGPLAGPVYAAAVILPETFDLPYLNDSKKVTPKRREMLFDRIKEQALSWSVASVDEREIDEINILNARMKAMDLAIGGLSLRPDLALIDGNQSRGISAPCRTVVHGDSLSASIAAASILAKVSRDRFMVELAKQYPEYRFEQHKGYGTALHYQMLEQYGPCPAHRMSFLKTFYERRH
ncbi:MAG: ribonuclease HII [Clostridiales bacterium]|nr:ribonuclease HII [Clostridiales bacterium]